MALKLITTTYLLRDDKKNWSNIRQVPHVCQNPRELASYAIQLFIISESAVLQQTVTGWPWLSFRLRFQWYDFAEFFWAWIPRSLKPLSHPEGSLRRRLPRKCLVDMTGLQWPSLRSSWSRSSPVACLLVAQEIKLTVWAIRECYIVQYSLIFLLKSRLPSSGGGSGGAAGAFALADFGFLDCTGTTGGGVIGAVLMAISREFRVSFDGFVQEPSSAYHPESISETANYNYCTTIIAWSSFVVP